MMLATINTDEFDLQKSTCADTEPDQKVLNTDNDQWLYHGVKGFGYRPSIIKIDPEHRYTLHKNKYALIFTTTLLQFSIALLITAIMIYLTT